MPMSENINQLNQNEVFVFGSNEAGIHGAGAAKRAIKWGATYGQGFGYSGQTFAIPTKDWHIKTLPIQKIDDYVSRFIDFAKNNPNLIFLVTPIGTGLAGFSAEEIAPLFIKAVDIENIILPKTFTDVLGEQ